MKYKFFLIVALFHFGNGLRAQPYIPLLTSNQKWEQFQGDGTSTCTWYAGQFLRIGTDTIISGTVYSKVIENPVISLAPQGFFCAPYVVNDTIENVASFLREDTLQKKVYIYNTITGSDELIYDFSAIAGDTLFNYYGPTGLTFTIDSVTVVTFPIIGDRKTYYVNSPGSVSGLNYYIEGIGGMLGFNQSLYENFGTIKMLTCVRDSLQDPIFGSCLSGFVGINENNKNNYIFNYNNSDFTLKCTNSTILYNISFYDLRGQLVYQLNNLMINYQYPIISNLNGLLFYTISIQDANQAFAGKIILIK